MFDFINRRTFDLPDRAGVSAFETQAHGDHAHVNGWTWMPTGNVRGTLFCLHGFTLNCTHQHYVPGWLECCERHNLALVTLDFRHHGKSSDRWPSFGTGEAWDLLGAMDHADRAGFPRPFIMHAPSLGALASQRVAAYDERIRGCFLLEPPQCARHAIRSAVFQQLPDKARRMTRMGACTGSVLINRHYRKDIKNILNDGDVRRHPAIHNPKHRPLMLFMMGTNDHFGIEATRKTYEAWYAGEPHVEGHGYEPHLEPQARKWFIEVPDAVHCGMPGKTVYHWEHHQACLDSFLERCLLLKR